MHTHEKLQALKTAYLTAKERYFQFPSASGETSIAQDLEEARLQKAHIAAKNAYNQALRDAVEEA